MSFLFNFNFIYSILTAWQRCKFCVAESTVWCSWQVVCKEFFNCIFSNYKITPSSSKGENKINKVIILDTHTKKINQMQGNQDKELPNGPRWPKSLLKGKTKFVTIETIIIYHNTYMYLKTMFKNNLLRTILNNFHQQVYQHILFRFLTISVYI